MSPWNAIPGWKEIGNTEWKGVLALGMGGSAAGGDFLSALCNLEGKSTRRSSA